MPTIRIYVRYCPSCNSRAKRYGKTASGTVRYRCLSCLKTFVSHQKQSAEKTESLELLEQYVFDGAIYRFLSKIHRIPVITLERKIHASLQTPPPALPLPSLPGKSYLIIDGKWFGKTSVMMIYRRSDTKTILHISFLKREYGSQIAKDLRMLKERYVFNCIVSDGGTGILHAVDEVFPHLPHQWCLAHAHRQATGALGKHPKDERVIELKTLADHVWKIESKEALKWWVKELLVWKQRNFLFYIERRTDTTGKSWYAHPGPRKTLRILLTVAKQSFAFLNQPLVPKTSNAIEASIGVLGDKKRIHRGLKTQRTEPFLRWFIYFYNKNILSQNIPKST